MPGFDGTGPYGKGSFTGRGMGYCVIRLDPSEDKNQQSKGRGVFDMPRGDGTGPMGLGPMTGRAAGFCAGYSMPGYVNPVSGRGFFGRGGGRGRRNWYYATGLTGWQRASMGMPAFGGVHSYMPEVTPKQELDILKKQLEDIQSRIQTLEKYPVEKSE
ncbi:MAG: DUF5320 domain-containing protein [Candidatus Omnitrophica bacterium]|nr:DUF5320 domain-containing protein [Candidatus Omnitrophota bacterium]MBU1869646.1 DUF5320 domain-containing protein [Candidatus Omnitrophota bacterium]